MGCHFSVVSLSTELLSHESIAVGMVTIDDDGTVATAFVADWDRARTFMGSDVAFALEFADDLRADSSLTVERLREMAGDFQNAIRLSDPSPVDVAASEWLSDYGHLFVLSA